MRRLALGLAVLVLAGCGGGSGSPDPTPGAEATGTANPTPSPPPEFVLICWLTPMTFPRASRSGPPELPGFTAASVWTRPSNMPPSGVGRLR